MTDLESRAADAKFDIKLYELELQQAELILSHGGRHLEEAKEKYGNLKIAVDTARVKLERARLRAEKAEQDAKKGFIEDSH